MAGANTGLACLPWVISEALPWQQLSPKLTAHSLDFEAPTRTIPLEKPASRNAALSGLFAGGFPAAGRRACAGGCAGRHLWGPEERVGRRLDVYFGPCAVSLRC